MTTWRLLTTGWDWEPSVIIGCAALLAVYAAVVRPRESARMAAFALGVLVLFLALVSPLDTLGDDYLLSAHMVQHLLLILFVPPLLLAGIPRDTMARWLRWTPAARAERVLGNPVLAWLIGSGTLAIWHLPALYDAALYNDNLHIFQHLTFLVASTIFWWPVFAPLPERRLPPLAATLYLIAAMFANSVLGILITFAAPGLYPAYARPPEDPAILRLVREGWGLTLAADQKVAGLIMWVPGGLVFLIAVLVRVFDWLSSPEDDEREFPLTETEPAGASDA